MKILKKMIYTLFFLAIFNQILATTSVLVDPGHGAGTGTSSGGVVEDDIVLDVGLKLYYAIENGGALSYDEVYITRITDVDGGISYRWKMANNYGGGRKDAYNNDIPTDGVDAFISIHTNSNPNTSKYGTEVYYGLNDGGPGITFQANREEKSDNFATVALHSYLHWIQEFFDDNNYVDPQIRSRWVRYHSVADVVQKTEMPAILVELDYLSNATARGYLQNADFQEAGASGIWQALTWTHPTYNDFVQYVVDQAAVYPPSASWNGHVLIKNSTPKGDENNINWQPVAKQLMVRNGSLYIPWGTYIVVDDKVSLLSGSGGNITVDQNCTTDEIFLGEYASIEGFDPNAGGGVTPGGTYPYTIITNEKCDVWVYPQLSNGNDINTTIIIPFYEHSTNINTYNFIYTQPNDRFYVDDWKKGEPLTAYGKPDVFLFEGKYYKFLRYEVDVPNNPSENSKDIIIKAYNDIVGSAGNGQRRFFMKHFYAQIGETVFKTYLNTTNEFNSRDVVKLKDPWYIDPVDPLYSDGTLPRKNLGQNAVYRKISQVSRVGSNKGVLLNITESEVFNNSNNLYKIQPHYRDYSFEVNGQTWIFDSWSGVNAEIVDPDPISKIASVIFTGENSEVWAHYKGHFISNSERPFGESNGRQIVSNRDLGDDLEHYMVYQDNGEIYFVKYYLYNTVNPEDPDYFTWSLEERISDGSGLNSNPSIAFMDEYKYICVWQKGNEIISREYNYTWQNITTVATTTHPDLQPAVGVYTLSLWGGVSHRIQIIWVDTDGVKYYEDQQTSTIPNTNSSCKNPTITSIYAGPSFGFCPDNIIVWESSADYDIYYHRLDEATTYNLTSGFTELSNNKSPSIAAGMIEPMFAWQATKNGEEKIFTIRLDYSGFGNLTEIEYSGYESAKPVVGAYGYSDFKLVWEIQDSDLLASLKYVNGNWQSLDQIVTYYDDALRFPVMSEYSEPENVVAASRYSSIPFSVVVDPVPATILSPIINTSTTLETGSIYHVKENVTLTNSAVLTIESGVKILLDPGTKIIVDNGSRIEALGTEVEPISFIQSVSSAWDRIQLFSDNNEFTWCVFDGGTYNVDVRSNSDVFSNCSFKNAERGINYYNVTDGSITNSVFQNNGYGIYLSESNPTLSSNTITNSTNNGIFMTSSSPALINNSITNNSGDGIYIYGGSPQFGSGVGSNGYNVIAENSGVGIYSIHSNLNMGSCVDCHSNGGNNSVYNNISDCSKCHESSDEIHIWATESSEIVAENNWWGSSEPDELSFIVGEGSTIDYNPWLSSDPNESKSRNILNKSIISDIESVENFDHSQLTNLGFGRYKQFKKNYIGAIGEYKKVISQNFMNINSRIALRNLVYCYKTPGLAGRGNFLEYLIRKYPKSKLCKLSLLLKSEYFVDKGRFNDAISLNDFILAQYPNEDKLKRLALFNKIMIYYFKLNDKTNANLALNQLKQLYQAGNLCQGDNLIYNASNLLKGNNTLIIPNEIAQKN